MKKKYKMFFAIIIAMIITQFLRNPLGITQAELGKFIAVMSAISFMFFLVVYRKGIRKAVAITKQNIKAKKERVGQVAENIALSRKPNLGQRLANAMSIFF